MKFRQTTSYLVLSFSLLLCLAGCKVQFIAPYDETLDTSMTKVQNDTELFFSKLPDDATYAANKSYYQQTEASLHTMETRAQAVPKSDAVADQIAKIEHTVETMQGTHERDGKLTGDVATLNRDLMESEFRSFFQLELTLKSGSTPTAAKPAPAKKK